MILCSAEIHELRRAQQIIESLAFIARYEGMEVWAKRLYDLKYELGDVIKGVREIPNGHEPDPRMCRTKYLKVCK